MERFLASPYCKILVLCAALLAVFAFGYHVARNLKLASIARQHSSGEAAASPNNPPPDDSLARPQRQP